jgi:hypothetical protein
MFCMLGVRLEKLRQLRALRNIRISWCHGCPCFRFKAFVEQVQGLQLTHYCAYCKWVQCEHAQNLIWGL